MATKAQLEAEVKQLQDVIKELYEYSPEIFADCIHAVGLDRKSLKFLQRDVVVTVRFAASIAGDVNFDGPKDNRRTDAGAVEELLKDFAFDAQENLCKAASVQLLDWTVE